MPFKTIAEEFAEFAEVIPSDAPEFQRRDMKMAFVAGFAQAFLRMMGQDAENATDAEIDAYGDAVLLEAAEYAFGCVTAAAMEE